MNDNKSTVNDKNITPSNEISYAEESDSDSDSDQKKLFVWYM